MKVCVVGLGPAECVIAVALSKFVHQFSIYE